MTVPGPTSSGHEGLVGSGNVLKLGCDGTRWEGN